MNTLLLEIVISVVALWYLYSGIQGVILYSRITNKYNFDTVNLGIGKAMGFVHPDAIPRNRFKSLLFISVLLTMAVRWIGGLLCGGFVLSGHTELIPDFWLWGWQAFHVCLLVFLTAFDSIVSRRFFVRKLVYARTPRNS